MKGNNRMSEQEKKIYNEAIDASIRAIFEADIDADNAVHNYIRDDRLGMISMLKGLKK